MDLVTIFSLVMLCVSSSASLYKAVDSIRSGRKDVRHLQSEVGDLNIVLQALAKNIEETSENFEILRLILEQCGRICKEFEVEVVDKIKRTDNRFQDAKALARLQLLKSDIDVFRNLINSYKATLTIALADSNLHERLLERYTRMTENATSDLKEQIAELSDKLEMLRDKGTQDLSEDAQYQSDGTPTAMATATMQTLEQKLSLEQCLMVCCQLRDHIEVAERSLAKGVADVASNTSEADTDARVDGFASRLTADALHLCTYNINTAVQHLNDLRRAKRQPDEVEQDRIIRQLDSARQCLDVVGQAQEHRVNVFEDIQTADDSFQTVVSTMGDLIRAKGLTIGARSVNLMGQMNDESLQRITAELRTTIAGRSASERENITFEKRHGFGHTIPPKTQ